MFLCMVEEMGCVITQPIFFVRILRSCCATIVPYTHITCIFLTCDIIHGNIGLTKRLIQDDSYGNIVNTQNNRGYRYAQPTAKQRLSPLGKHCVVHPMRKRG